MKLLNLESFVWLSTFAICTLGVTAVPTPANGKGEGPKPTSTCTPAPNKCKPEYTIHRYGLDFEDISPLCYYGQCGGISIFNFTSPRGAGVAYQKYSDMQKPLLIPNVAGWAAINCTWDGFAGRDERYACGNATGKALYSPGKSPWDPKLKPRLNTVDFPDTYITGALESLYVTPIRLPNGTKTATFELIATKTDGKTVKYEATLNIASGVKRFLISDLIAKGFKDVKAVDFWLSAGGKGGFEFALDDLVLDEYRPLPLPPSCYPPTQTVVEKGPCTPKAIRTTTWTADAEDMTPTASVVSPHTGVNWNGLITVQDTDTLSYFYPPDIETQSGKNFYTGYSPFTLYALEQEQRFGLNSLSVACSFANFNDNYLDMNNRPCDIYIVGRRDPYDGDGLPNFVTLNYTIPHPGDVTSQKFTKIDLDKLSTSPGKFSRLYSLSVYTSQKNSENYTLTTNFAVDDVVLFRGTTVDDPKCRVPGGKTLDFDDLKVGSTPTKVGTYKGFLFGDGWTVASKKNYSPGEPGFVSVTSGQNSIWSGYSPDPDQYLSIEIGSYVNPKDNFLFDFEEVTITLDIPKDMDPARLNDIRFTFYVNDACGAGSGYYNGPHPINPTFYYKTVQPGKMQMTLAEPLHAISKIAISASFYGGDYEKVNFFIDDLKYRKYEGPTPGCWRCGFRGGDWCEVPDIKGR